MKEKLSNTSILYHNNLKHKLWHAATILFTLLTVPDDGVKEVIQPQSQQIKQWLKSNEVRKLLNISPGTLQNLRINGTLTYTKIGGIMYYSYSDIEKVLNGNSKSMPNKFGK